MDSPAAPHRLAPGSCPAAEYYSEPLLELNTWKPKAKVLTNFYTTRSDSESGQSAEVLCGAIPLRATLPRTPTYFEKSNRGLWGETPTESYYTRYGTTIAPRD
jgi:hypothetical protein